MRFNFKLIFFSLSLLILFGCEDQNGEAPQPFEGNLFEQLQQLDEYSIFTNTLEITGLSTELSSDNLFTVFAPNDSIFTIYLQENNVTSINALQPELLESIIRYHITTGDNSPTKLTNNLNASTLLSGGTLSITVQVGDWRVNNIPFSFNGNFRTSNGTIYPVSKLISLPEILTPEPPVPTIAKLLEDNSEYSYFFQLLQKGSLIETLNDTTKRSTVFLFNDASFSNFLSQKGFDDIFELPDYISKNFAAFHIVDGMLSIDELRQTITQQTLLEKELEIVVEGNTTRIKSPLEFNSSLVFSSELEVNNGVIYLIDFPTDTPITFQNFLQEEEEFSWLKESLMETEIWSVLDDLDTQLTLIASENSTLEAYISNQTSFSSIEDFTASSEAFPLATYHIINQANLNTQELKVVSTLSKLSNEDLNRSLLLSPSGFINEQIKPSVGGKYNNYYVSNGNLLFTEELIDYVTVNDLVEFHPQTNTLEEIIKNLNFQNSLNSQNITFLAPQDNAFTSVVNNATNGIDSLQQITSSLLFYHLSTGYNTSESLTTGDVLSTFLVGQRLNVSTTNQLTFFGNRSTTRVLLSDFVTENGVLHLVDEVLLP